MLLLLEDDHVLRETLTDFLSEQYEVVAAPNGTVGVMLLERFGNAICGILTDYEMPMMNGIEFLRFARSKGFMMPALVMTGKDLSQDEMNEVLLLTGCQPLLKPIDFDTILAEVQQRLSLPSSGYSEGSSPAL
ncbi:MAG: response regulator [Chloroherpetonaceae bacterium]|nr:response regulator [Chloroherpetonaceae bacterium]MDW8019781.1 response regulator [Chloroherpetonaceae bacterium]